MLNENGTRELAYITHIDEIRPIPNYDRVEYARVGGWWVIVRKDQFKVGDLAIYIEVDSKVPADNPAFEFLAQRHFKVKTLKMCKVISQGLLMEPADFGWTVNNTEASKSISTKNGILHEGDFLTTLLGISYAEDEDNKRKANSEDKYQKMAHRHPKIFKSKFGKQMMKTKLGRNIMFFFFGKKKDKKNGFPVGRFPGVAKTDQERCENMPYILKDKTPYIITQKCDGSSGTYILERKGKRKFEFYVCSRNVRMINDKQECFYGSHNYYWEVAIKYDIERKMREWLIAHPKAEWVCWQGEICAPEIQKNPHHLTETHFFCFHWTDSIDGRLSILKAKERWLDMDMEVVPIVNENYILPDDFEEFKLSADGKYDPIVCEGNSNCAREGYVYYKTTDPTFSFKNVSREYLLKH